MELWSWSFPVKTQPLFSVAVVNPTLRYNGNLVNFDTTEILTQEGVVSCDLQGGPPAPSLLSLETNYGSEDPSDNTAVENPETCTYSMQNPVELIVEPTITNVVRVFWYSEWPDNHLQEEKTKWIIVPPEEKKYLFIWTNGKRKPMCYKTRSHGEGQWVLNSQIQKLAWSIWAFARTFSMIFGASTPTFLTVLAKKDKLTADSQKDFLHIVRVELNSTRSASCFSFSSDVWQNIPLEMWRYPQFWPWSVSKNC